MDQQETPNEAHWAGPLPMPRSAGTLDLVLPPRWGGQPAQRWVYEGVRAAILDGRLRAGARLPASRDLGLQHGLARGTVVAAFAQLQAEGYVRSTVGSGTFVGDVPPDVAQPQVWLARDSDRERAEVLLRAIEAEAAQGGSHRCPACGEESPGNFDLCWNCGRSL